MKKRRITGAVLAAVMAFTGICPEFFGGCITANAAETSVSGSAIDTFADETAYDFTYPVTGGNIYLTKVTPSMIDYRVYAFYDHEFLIVTASDDTVTAAEIPSKIGGFNVERIGSKAFEKNTNLTSVIIPDSVKIIGSYAFGDCSSLANVTFSGTLEAIDSGVFMHCKSLTSIDIPEGVETVSLHCFVGCKMLQKVHLPSTIKKIEGAPFAQCNRLTEINIPEGVESIGMSAFADCHNLGEIYIPESVKEIGYWAFENCYGIHAHIPRTTAVIGEGAFKKNLTSGGEYVYPVLYVEKGSVAYEYAVMNGLPYVITGEYKNKAKADDIIIQSVTMYYNGMKYNLLNEAPAVVEGDTDSGEISVDIDWGDKNPNDYVVYLRMGDYVSDSPITNTYDFVPGTDLTPEDVMGVGVFKKAYDGNGDGLVTAKKLQLRVAKKYVHYDETKPRVTEKDDGWEVEFPIMDDLDFLIDDYIPVLGNESFEIPMKKLKAEFELDEDNHTFTCTIGRDKEKEENKEKAEKLDEFKKWKEAVKDTAKDVKSGGNASDIMNTLKKRFGQQGLDVCGIKKGWEPEFSATGYIEGTYDDDGLTSLKGELIAFASIKFEYKGQAYVSAVPVVYGIGAGGSIKGTVGIDIKKAIELKDLRSAFYGSIVLTPEMSITGGVGFVNVAELDATGHAKLPIEIHTHENYQKVSVAASADIKLLIGPYTIAELTSPEISKTIYETGVTESYSQHGVETYSNIYAQIDQNAPLTPIDRSYISSPSEWNESSFKAFGTDAKVLQKNIYPYSHPVLTQSGNDRLLVWIADDAKRDDYNSSVLMYSKYNENTDTWSTPLPVYDDGMLDMSPEVKNGYIVWQKANRKLTAEDSLTDLAKSSEIWIAGFNGNSFEAKRLTNDEEMDSQPALDTFGTNIAVVWSKNTENDFFGTSGKNSICMKEFKDGEWQETEVIADGLNIIDSVSVGLSDAKPVVVYSLDKDNKLDTVDDRELFVIENGKTTQFTNDDVIDTKPVFAYLNGEKTLFWYKDGMIKYVNSFDEPVYGGIPVNVPSDEVSIASFGDNAAVFYTNAKENGAEVCVSLYDGTQWSQKVCLAEESGDTRIKYPSGLIDRNGNITTVYNTENNGVSNLCVLTTVPECDIEAGRLFVGGIEPNSEIPVLFDIKNTGEKTVDSVNIELTDPEGNVNYSYTLNETILPGEVCEAKAIYTTGENIVPGEITVKISTYEKESDTTNNISTFETGLADIKTGNVVVTEKNDGFGISVDVTNSGYKAAENVRVFISENDNNENMLYTQEIGTLEPNETKTVVFDVKKSNFSEDTKYIFAGSVSTSDEEYIANNYTGFAFAATKNFVYGDADGNGKVEANDAAVTLQKALVSTFKMPIENKTSNWLKYTDVDNDSSIGANDSIVILQKTLSSTYQMPVEKNK